MSKAPQRSLERVAWFLALVFMLLGTGALLRAALVARDRIDGMYQKQTRILKLELLKYEADGLRSAVLTLERDTSSRPVSMASLVQTYLENADVKIHPLPPVETGYGWQVQRAELQLEHLAWDEISRFLRKVEDQRPPWRIQKLNLKPKDDTGLSGTLLLHAMQKSEI